MKLTQKLLGYLNRVFSKDPKQFLALRLQYSGTGMTWFVQDNFLTTQVTGGPGQNLTIDLSQYTLNGLVNYIAGKAGYSIPYSDVGPNAQLSAKVLLDGSGDINTSNGDHIYGYTSLLFVFLESCSDQLNAASLQIVQMLRQMQTRDEDGNSSAVGEWIDEIGGYFGIPRTSGEPDGQYAIRIPTEVIRARGNNVAIEMALLDFTGQPASVVDVTIWGSPSPTYNAGIHYNAGSNYNTAATPVYGLFDVTFGYDLLNGQDVSAYITTVTGIIDRLRDAGTHLRSLALAGGTLGDTAVPPSEVSPDPDAVINIAGGFSDSPGASPTDSAGIDWILRMQYNGLRTYGGASPYVNPYETIEALP